MYNYSVTIYQLVRSYIIVSNVLRRCLCTLNLLERASICNVCLSTAVCHYSGMDRLRKTRKFFKKQETKHHSFN